MLIAIGIAVGAIFLLIVWKWLSSPVSHRTTPAELGPFLEALLRRGHNGARMFVDVPGEQEYLQFTKYIASPGRFGLEMAFPDAGWSRQSYANVRRFLSTQQLPLREERTGRPDTVAFLNVDFARDVDRAAEVAAALLSEHLQVAPNRRVVVRLLDISPNDALLDG
jgi:hypothetical protein